MPDTDSATVETPENKEFTCQRCGFTYNRQKDWEPFLCNRCLRYLGKKVYTAVLTIVPVPSRTTESEV